MGERKASADAAHTMAMAAPVLDLCRNIPADCLDVDPRDESNRETAGQVPLEVERTFRPKF
jgi:hypothetical protein